MKKIASFILAVAFFMIGCQDDNSILGPNNELSDASSSPKGRLILANWIELPDDGTLAKVGDTDGAGWTVTQKVPSNQDTKLIIEEKYEGGIHGVVKISTVLKIYAGTVKEDTYVTLNVDDEYGIVTFSSPQAFNKKAELYVTFVGLDLDDVESEDIEFIYLDETEEIMGVESKAMTVDESTGTISLYAGMVSEFAQYGFVTEEDD
jgi:hypothetical protein